MIINKEVYKWASPESYTVKRIKTVACFLYFIVLVCAGIVSASIVACKIVPLLHLPSVYTPVLVGLGTALFIQPIAYTLVLTGILLVAILSLLYSKIVAAFKRK